MQRFVMRIFWLIVIATAIGSFGIANSSFAQTFALRIFTSSSMMGYLEPCG
jgi:hypothetical protein